MTSSTPRVSIGLPVYNGENYIKEALDSILAQTYTDFELIISDNASTDGTQEICEAYAAKDPRVRYHRNEQNLGGAGNFNHVVELSRGEFFRVAHHDDILEPECVETCVELLDQEPDVILCYTDATMIDEHGKPFEPTRSRDYHLRSEKPHERFEKYLNQFYPVGGGINFHFGVMRRDVLLKTALMGNYAAGDLMLFGELALLGQFHRITTKLYRRRSHPSSATRSNLTPEAVATWFDPGNKGKVIMNCTRWLFAYSSAVRRAPMSLRERLRCLVVLRRSYLRYSYKTIVRELGSAVRKKVFAGFYRRSMSKGSSADQVKVMSH